MTNMLKNLLDKTNNTSKNVKFLKQNSDRFKKEHREDYIKIRAGFKLIEILKKYAENYKNALTPKVFVEGDSSEEIKNESPQNVFFSEFPQSFIIFIISAAESFGKVEVKGSKKSVLYFFKECFRNVKEFKQEVKNFHLYLEDVSKKNLPPLRAPESWVNKQHNKVIEADSAFLKSNEEGMMKYGCIFMEVINQMYNVRCEIVHEGLRKHISTYLFNKKNEIVFDFAKVDTFLEIMENTAIYFSFRIFKERLQNETPVD